MNVVRSKKNKTDKRSSCPNPDHLLFNKDERQNLVLSHEGEALRGFISRSMSLVAAASLVLEFREAPSILKGAGRGN